MLFFAHTSAIWAVCPGQSVSRVVGDREGVVAFKNLESVMRYEPST